MTNREWLIKRITESDNFLAELVIVNEPTVDDDYGWCDHYTNVFNRKYKKATSSCYRDIFGYPQEYEAEQYYTSYSKCEEDVLAWLNEEHIEEVKSNETSL